MLPPSICRTRLYDSQRRPHDWPGTLSSTEVAIFLTDVRSRHELTAKGTALHSSAESSCYVAPDWRRATEFCDGLIGKNQYLRCEISDRRGRSVDAIAEILHPVSGEKARKEPAAGKTPPCERDRIFGSHRTSILLGLEALRPSHLAKRHCR